MNKKILISLSAIAVLSQSLQAGYVNQTDLYINPLNMGMGGTDIAIYNSNGSVFNNPAGIAMIDKKEGFKVDLIEFSGSATQNISEYIDDLNKASESENIEDISDYINKYNEKHTSITGSNYSSIANNEYGFAFELGILSNLEANILPVSYNDYRDRIETYSGMYNSGNIAFASNYSYDVMNLYYGINTKYLKYESYNGALSRNDLIDNKDNFKAVIEDKIEKQSGSNITADVGLIMNFNTVLNPSIGLSITNIGNIDLGYKTLNQSINLGFSVYHDFNTILNRITLAMDYRDITNNQDIIYYDYSYSNDMKINGNTKYIKSNDDIDNNLRLGSKIDFINNKWSEVSVSAGVYNGEPTFGGTLRMSVFSLNASMWTEKIGSSEEYYKDDKYMASLGIVW